jgi:hypothetical protein
MLAKLVSRLREFGLADGLFYLFDRALLRLAGRHLLFRYAFVAQPVPRQPLLPAHRGRNLEIRRLESGDPALGALEVEERVARHRFGQGAVCFGVFKAGRPIGCIWPCLGPFEEDEVRCRYEPEPPGKASWDLGVYLLPEERGGIAFARLWDAANAYLASHGIAWTLSRISVANQRSLTAHLRLGARRIGTATYLVLGRLQLMVASTPPGFHCALSPTSRPTLRLHAPEDNPSIPVSVSSGT